jgi:uncharacterized membrane protein YhaH (DUF805 family)
LFALASHAILRAKVEGARPWKHDFDLPDFAFPVVAWAPEAATGDPTTDGTLEFVSARWIAATQLPETDRRLGWTFVDAEGRCWEVMSSQVAGRADGWLTWLLPRRFYSPTYNLNLDFEDRPPVAFDQVKSRLFTAVRANPKFHRGYARERLQQLRQAESLADLIKSDEARAIERLQPTSLVMDWLTGDGRCSRLSFFVLEATILIGLLTGMRIVAVAFPVSLTIVVLSLVFGLSAVIRRLHDLRLTGWWLSPWFLWSWVCAGVHDHVREPVLRTAAASAWQISTLCALLILTLWSGTRGPNRYGLKGR